MPRLGSRARFNLSEINERCSSFRPALLDDAGLLRGPADHTPALALTMGRRAGASTNWKGRPQRRRQWQNLDKEFATCAIPLVSTSELSAVSPLLARRMPVKPPGNKATILPPQPIIRG
jgi:hypothetical protein